jgi:antitoxin component of RelBE/YafQ-DinJ toxin-antitoxin module
MSSKLHPVTFKLPDELMAESTLTAHAKGMTREEWVSILVKQAMNELPAQADENQTLADAAKTLTALETEDDKDFNAEAFEREFAQAQLDVHKS